MKLSCRAWSGIHLTKAAPTKSGTPSSAGEPARSSGSRGAAESGAKQASNAHPAPRQGEKASASKANGKRRAPGGEKKTAASR